MNCTVDYSVFGRVADHCGQQEVFGYLLLALLVACVFIVVAIASQKTRKETDEDDYDSSVFDNEPRLGFDLVSRHDEMGEFGAFSNSGSSNDSGTFHD